MEKFYFWGATFILKIWSFEAYWAGQKKWKLLLSSEIFRDFFSTYCLGYMIYILYIYYIYNIYTYIYVYMSCWKCSVGSGGAFMPWKLSKSAILVDFWLRLLDQTFCWLLICCTTLGLQKSPKWSWSNVYGGVRELKKQEKSCPEMGIRQIWEWGLWPGHSKSISIYDTKLFVDY